MNKKRIVKTLLHYFGEILVVTIGIFIAFQLNNYSDNQKLKIREESALKRIVSDLETEKAWLEKLQKHFTKSKEKLENIVYKGDRKNLDSLYYHIATEYVHYNNNVEYSALKFSGNLYLVSNDSIRSSLIQHYELNYAYSEKIAERHKEFVKEYILEYLSDEISSDAKYLYDSLKVEEKLKNKDFVSRLESQAKWYGVVLTTIKLDYVNKLINRINNEVKEKAQ